jgi:1-acyl-sn-glycerol-3-phosphate acyltransferase
MAVRGRYAFAMPRRRLRRWIARSFLAATGWEAEGPRPEPDRYVLIAAPHTTNWDFPYLLAFATIFDLEISWMGKSSLFRPPFGGIMRFLGGIPIRRERSHNVVASMVEAFAVRERLGLVVPAEGTRDYVDHWKSGFYHIARTARVPIVLSYLDYSRRRGGFGPVFHPSGEIKRDMDRIRAFYADKQGKFPERFGRIRLREEDATRSGGPGSEDLVTATIEAVRLERISAMVDEDR